MNSIDHHNNPETYYRGEYWHKPGVYKAVTQFLGSQAIARNNSEHSWSLAETASEFIAVSNWEKALDPAKKSPATIIETDDFGIYLEKFGGQVELHSSLWQKSSSIEPEYPSRVLFSWDIDIYDKEDPARLLDDPKSVFTTLEPVYQSMKDILNHYSIPHIAVASGKGYNFLTSLPGTSHILDTIINMAIVEPTVLGKQAHPDESFKRRHQVPPNTEKAHVIAARLQQFIFNSIIRHARMLTATPVEISDRGKYGIALDNTSMLSPINHRTFGSLGSPYFIKAANIYPGFDNTIIRIPRAGNGFEIGTEALIDIRQHYTEASDFLSSVDCQIPDGSQGIEKLLVHYLSSDLHGLHQSLDTTYGDRHEDFHIGYRNYDAIADRTDRPERIRYLINNANDELLKPDNINEFVWTVFESWGGNLDNLEDTPSHVAGLLRAIYEDPSFNWGSRWHKEDALRFARGWVAIILGQHFEA